MIVLSSMATISSSVPKITLSKVSVLSERYDEVCKLLETTVTERERLFGDGCVFDFKHNWKPLYDCNRNVIRAIVLLVRTDRRFRGLVGDRLFSSDHLRSGFELLKNQGLLPDTAVTYLEKIEELLRLYVRDETIGVVQLLRLLRKQQLCNAAEEVQKLELEIRATCQSLFKRAGAYQELLTFSHKNASGTQREQEVTNPTRYSASDVNGASLWELLKFSAELEIFLNTVEGILSHAQNTNSSITVTSDGFSMPEIPIAFYTEKSSEDLVLPKANSYCLSQGSVLQSAREAIVYRMHEGKDDLNYYYNTRTVVIYFKENNELFVAFDDDPINNILLSRAQEGYDASNNWLVNTNDPLIENAIKRAKEHQRIIKVTTQNSRDDSLAVAKCIIGDKTEKYDAFLKKHLNRNLKSYVLDISDCKNVTNSQVLLRLVGVGGDNYGDDILSANNLCDVNGRARGVRKIFSSGNGGLLVPYVGLLLQQENKLFGSTQEMLSYFMQYEQKLNAAEQGLFYAGINAVRFSITKDTLDASVQSVLALVQHPTKHLNEFFLLLPQVQLNGTRIQPDELAGLARDVEQHYELLSDPLKFSWWIELRRHNALNADKTLLDRLKSRREGNFKEVFLKSVFKQRYNADIDMSDLPLGTLSSMFSCDKITKDVIAESLQAIQNSKKQFPKNKTYYFQTSKGITVQSATPAVVQEAIISLITIMLTQQSRWSARHDEAAKQVNTLINNEQKVVALINFSRSCINQGAAFKNAQSLFEQLKNKQLGKEELLRAIEQFLHIIRTAKYDAINETQLNSKIEPLNDILVMLRSHLREQETMTGVAIISQKPRITDIMGYDTTHCCAFYPYNNEDGILGYLEDDNIGLLQYFILNGKKPSTIYGVIIFAICDDRQGNATLLIDSAEGDENMLTIMKNWQSIYRDAIRSLAKDIGAKQVVYGDDAGNTVPKKFLEHLQSQGLQKTSTYLKKRGKQKRADGDDFYLESFNDGCTGNVDGYVERL